jgi:hypothetical protein
MGGGSLWAGEVGKRTVERIDPRSGAVAARVSGEVGAALLVADGALWTITRAGVVTRIAAA